MRGAFDTTCDLWSGPGALVPNNLYAANVPCRLVADTIADEAGKWIGSQSHYLTIDAHAPVGAEIVHVIPGYSIDCTKADRVSVPSGVAPNYGVLWVEHVTPSTGTPYYRAHLVQLPDPDGEY